jgi:SHS2 domain-containing protein
MKPFEIVEHTADVGLVARGRTLPELFANAALGMMSLLVDADSVAPGEAMPVSVEADDRATLLAALLSELLFRLEVDRFVTHHIAVSSLSDVELHATAYGERIGEHHEFLGEIKAVTHHDLTVEPDGDAWRATVLFDV